MIPKIIHYCWLSGDRYPGNIEKCIESWKRVLPDYEYKLWSKDTFDITCNLWVNQAFEKKKYAFAADYIRFWSLYNYGGIYLDSDIEVVRSYNNLLNNECFMGFEYLNIPEAATIGAEPGQEWIKDCMNFYNDKAFCNEDGSLNIDPVPYLVRLIINRDFNTDIRDNGKIQEIGNIKLFPYQYFSPKNFYTGKIESNSNTYSIHRFASAWGPGAKNRSVMTFHNQVIKIIGKERHDKLYRSIKKYPEVFNGYKV